jgi:hypothetical protein
MTFSKTPAAAAAMRNVTALNVGIMREVSIDDAIGP